MCVCVSLDPTYAHLIPLPFLERLQCFDQKVKHVGVNGQEIHQELPVTNTRRQADGCIRIDMIVYNLK